MPAQEKLSPTNRFAVLFASPEPEQPASDSGESMSCGSSPGINASEPKVRAAYEEWKESDWKDASTFLKGFANAEVPLYARAMATHMMRMDAALFTLWTMHHEVADTVEEVKDSLDDRRSSGATASVRPATEEDDKILLRGCNWRHVERLQRGDCTWVGEAKAWFRRSWQSSNGTWCVVMEINPHQRSVFTRNAKELKRTEGITVTPFLTSWGMQLRRERMEVFESLREQGLSPKWHRGVGIRFVKDGLMQDYEF